MKMNRKKFLGVATGALAGSVLSGYMPKLTYDASPPKNAITSDPMSAADFQAERQYAETRFGKITYIERGSGKAALFLHGFPLNSFQWRGVLEPLSAYRRCIAPDFMGLGYTEVADGQSIAPADQVSMLASFLDTLSISTVDIVANDSGGQAAQLFVAKHPERVRTLLLTNCDTEKDSPPDALLPVIEMSKAGIFVKKWLAPWLADKELARSDEGLGGQTYTYRTHPTDEAIEYYLTPLVNSPDRTHQFAIALEKNPLIGIESALNHFKAPTRIVWGTADTIFSSSSPEYLDRIFGNSQGVRLLPGRKLFWPEEFPDIIIEELRKLWSN